MYCLDYAERPHPGNQLHELVFLGMIHSSHRIYIRSHLIRIVVNFYNHTFLLRDINK